MISDLDFKRMGPHDRVFESGDTGAVLGAKLRQDASFGKMGRGGLHRPLCPVSAGDGDRHGAFHRLHRCMPGREMFKIHTICE